MKHRDIKIGRLTIIVRSRFVKVGLIIGRRPS